MNDRKPPDIKEIVLKKLWRKFGIPGLVVITVILPVAFYILSHWNEVKTWPGIAFIVTSLSRQPIPKADPNRFTILVAHLENDTNRENEHLILDDLMEFKGIQVLSLDRTIPLEGLVPEEKEKRGHEIARRYLKQSGASVLLWGKVLNQGSNTIPKLYWTASLGGELKLKPKRYDAPKIEEQLRLPEVFWSDLAKILHLLVASSDANFCAEEGQYVADRLSPFIDRVRTLLKSSINRPGWDIDARGSTRMILANALLVFGVQSGKNVPLKEAIAAHREALKELTRERVPLDWAATQNNLGNALQSLGERESGTELLKEAVAAYREALKERNRERVPLDWATTQNNLGNALQSLGERESGIELLKEAIAAHREALKELTRERVPLYWATTQNNLGSALLRLGERESGTEHLKEAIAIYREALKVRTRERVPLDWAATQNNLGNSLHTLGERESGTERLEESVAAYREALKVHIRKQVPLYWAMTQNNLGNSLTRLGERESGTRRLEEAVAAYREALKERTREQVPLNWAATQNNLGLALLRLGEREECESGTECLEEAVTAYKAALEFMQATPGTKANLKRAEALLHERRKGH